MPKVDTTDEDLSFITNNINDIITKKSPKITNTEIAKKTGLTNQMVSVYRKGDRLPGVANLRKIAKAFGVTINDLAYSPTEKMQISIKEFNNVKSEIETKYQLVDKESSLKDVNTAIDATLQQNLQYTDKNGNKCKLNGKQAETIKRLVAAYLNSNPVKEVDEAFFG
ncbi:helix-turn-helix domain-containing protein [Limosilactobacillus antri]|uniref:helix-turn-helix domain-containing protein n=1 Tax=Limosilactobacillus antri TaxID=227943 RepID=UPI001F57473B|nr:helix-turn-helix transcriptional regulator [Limosilactobacillus antri]